MKKLSLLLFIVFVSLSAFAQNRYVIFFADKNNSPYSISTPSAFLSQRAIARRSNQNIVVTTQDLPVNPSYVSGVSGTGAVVLNTSKWFNSVTIEVSNQSVLNDVLALPYVTNSTNVGRVGLPSLYPDKFKKENYIAKTPSIVNERVAVNFSYGNSFNQVSMINGDIMHQNSYTGMGMIIAVIDAGFSNVDNMPAFDSLRAYNRILDTWDFVDNEQNVYDDDAHGTMVLSLMGGQLPGELIGTAPYASYMLLRSENAPAEALIEEYNWASAAEYADSAGADIINSSLGYTRFDDSNQDHSYSDLDGNTTPVTIAADIAASKGMVVCNSAGNEGNSNWFHISAPADADSILAVGAVDPMAVYATFSGKGPSFDGRVKPDVATQGAQAWVADPWNGIGTFPGNGTSFASPILAGMVACLWQCHPNATNMQIINAVRQSATQSGNPDSLLGYGIPDFPTACMLLSGINPGISLNDDQVFVLGNPFGDELSFNFFTSQPQEINVKIFDLAGKLIYMKKQEASGLVLNYISLQAPFSKGVYLLEVETKNKVITKKVIKQ